MELFKFGLKSPSIDFFILKFSDNKVIQVDCRKKQKGERKFLKTVFIMARSF